MQRCRHTWPLAPSCSHQYGVLVATVADCRPPSVYPLVFQILLSGSGVLKPHRWQTTTVHAVHPAHHYVAQNIKADMRWCLGHSLDYLQRMCPCQLFECFSFFSCTKFCLWIGTGCSDFVSKQVNGHRETPGWRAIYSTVLLFSFYNPSETFYSENIHSHSSITTKLYYLKTPYFNYYTNEQNAKTK